MKSCACAYGSGAAVLRFQTDGNHLEAHQAPEVTGLVSPGWGLRTRIAKEFPGDAEAAGPGPTV